MIRRHHATAGLTASAKATAVRRIFTRRRKTCATPVCALSSLLIFVAACHVAPRPASGPAHPAPPAPPALSQLRVDIDAILGDAALEHGSWGVLIRSLARD